MHSPPPLLALLVLIAAPAPAQEGAAPAKAAPATLSQATFDPAAYLTGSRWADGCYGVSLIEPKNMRRSATSARWLNPGRGAEYDITLNFLLPPPRADNRPPQPLFLKDSAASMQGNLAGGLALATPLPDFTRDFEVEKHPCTVSYCLLQPKAKRNEAPADSFLVGIGVLQVTPYNHLVLRLVARIPAGTQGELPHLVEAQRTLEAMLKSARTTPESTLLALREAQLERGQQALSLLIPERITKAVPPAHLLRIVQNDKDMGWMRLALRQQDEAWYRTHPPKPDSVDGLGQPGLLVAVQTHTQSDDPKDGSAVDVQQTFFKSDASPYETWQRTTTWREAKAAAQSSAEIGFLLPPKDKTPAAIASLCVEWAGSTPANMANFFSANPQWRQTLDSQWNKIESGLSGIQRRPEVQPPGRNNPRGRTVSADVDKDGKPIPIHGDLYKAKWGIPLAQPYLSQAHAWLMPWLLPADRAQSYSFAFYSPESKRPGFCLLRVVPAGDGSRQVFFRPALDQPEQVFSFDGHGKLLRIQLPDGTALIPASVEELARIWKFTPEASPR